jgi:hypothetical protein
VFAAYRHVTPDYAQVSVPVGVRCLLRGLKTATFSRATIRCRLLQSVLVCPVIWLIYRVFGDSEDTFVCCVLPCTSPVAVRLQ